MGLSQTLNEFWDELGADFTRFYGFDLRQLCYSSTEWWGCRRLRTHIVNLPADSAFVRKQLNAPLGWDNTTELTAAVVDSVQYLSRLFYNANAKEADSSELPRVLRPHEPIVEPPTISFAELEEFLKE